MRTDRQTDTEAVRHDETNSRFLATLRTRPKKKDILPLRLACVSFWL